MITLGQLSEIIATMKERHGVECQVEIKCPIRITERVVDEEGITVSHNMIDSVYKARLVDVRFSNSELPAVRLIGE